MSKFKICDKLKIINIVSKIGNTRKACKELNISCTQFYHYKKTLKEQGLLGLGNKIKTGRKRNKALDDEILALILKYPLLSAESARKKVINKQLTTMGLYKILKVYGLEDKNNRYKIIEDKIKFGSIRKLSAQQKLFLTEHNACFAYYDQVSYPAQQISQDIVSYSQQNYLHIIIDRHSHYVFARITKKKTKQQISELLQQAIDWFATLKLTVKTVYSSDLKIFNGYQDSPYQQIVNDNQLDLHTVFTRPRFDDCIEHFLSINGDYIANNITDLLDQNKMDVFITNYNNQYRHKHYPHYGKTPQDMIKDYLQLRKSWLKSQKILQKTPCFILPVTTTKIRHDKIHKQNKRNLDKEISLICATQNLFFKK
ncbi:Integrase [uncultured Candidatus Thioglobus sp.]|nr:Integrase [uncultured Candidatus Thioglobus sp.]